MGYCQLGSWPSALKRVSQPGKTFKERGEVGLDMLSSHVSSSVLEKPRGDKGKVLKRMI